MRSIAGMPIAPSRSRWPIFVLALFGAVGLGVLSWKLVADRTGKDSTSAAMPAEPTETIAMTAPQPPPPPAQPAPPVVKRGTLEVKVSGAKDSVILVDGEEWGRGASLKVELDQGQHTVTVKPPGRATISQVVIDAGAVNSIALVVPAPQPPRVIRVQKKDTAKPRGDDDLLTPRVGGDSDRARRAARRRRRAGAAPKPASPAQKQADALFEKGLASYQGGKYQDAIAQFKQAYDLVHDPVYLFNIAQSYRKVADCTSA